MAKGCKQPKEEYKLFIDELGTASPKDVKSSLYILSGCSVNKSERANIKTWADQIKYKYWGRTDIVLHSREIGRKENDFSIFQDKDLFEEFLNDLEDFLLHSKFKLFFILVDKLKARKAGWNDVKIFQETTTHLIKNFILILLTGESKGEVIIESASAEKDIYLLRSFNYFLSGGIKKPKVSYKKVQVSLTSASFVTKRNHDIEEQIADLFAYAAKLKYQNIKTKKGSYEDMMCRLLNKKIFKIPRNAQPTKGKFFKEVKPFLVLPDSKKL